jgi:hypothetical protein
MTIIALGYLFYDNFCDVRLLGFGIMTVVSSMTQDLGFCEELGPLMADGQPLH